MLELKKAADKLERANDVRWYDHVLRLPEEDVLMKARVHKFDGKHKQGRPKMKWREQIEGNLRWIGLRKKDVEDWCRFRECVKRIVEIVR